MAPRFSKMTGKRCTGKAEITAADLIGSKMALRPRKNMYRKSYGEKTMGKMVPASNAGDIRRGSTTPKLFKTACAIDDGLHVVTDVKKESYRKCLGAERTTLVSAKVDGRKLVVDFGDDEVEEVEGDRSGTYSAANDDIDWSEDYH